MDMDLNELLIALAKLAGLGVIIGIGARLALPGDQHMGPAKTVLYGIAGALIGGGLALLMDLNDMFVALAGTIVSILLIGALHQHGIIVPEDAPDGVEGPLHQGGDLLDRVTRNDDGDLEREAAAAEAEAEEAAQEAADRGAVVVDERVIVVAEPEVVEADAAADDVDVVDAPAADPVVSDDAVDDGTHPTV